MSEKERNKAGLHKRISSIFSGVQIPPPDSGKESSGTCMPEDADYAELNQAEQIIPKVESTQENEAEPVQEPKVEPVQELKNEPAHAPKFITAHESEVVPVHESEIESFKDSKAESTEELKVELIEESKVEPIQELKNEPAPAPKFITAQESEVVPVQESEIESFKDSKVEPAQETKAESVQEPKAEPAHAPKFVTAQESKVIPIQESEAEPAQKSETESAPQSKLKTTKKPKVIPVQQSEKADIGNISKKVSEKRSVVKVGAASSLKQIASKLFTAKPGASGTKQKAMVVIVPVLFVVLVIFVLKGGVFGTSVHNAQAGEENNNSAVVPAGLDNQIDWEIPEPYPTTLRDPMKLGRVVTGTNQAESGELVQLIVKGILYSEDSSSAIIDNRIVHEGDRIQGANVINIDKDGVEFEMNGKKWTQKVQR